MAEIGLSGLMLDYPYSGTAVYSRQLIAHLPQAAPDLRFRVYMRNSREPVTVSTTFLSTPLARLNRGTGLGARLDKLAWEIVALPAAALFRRDALLHSLYFAAPIIAPSPLVVTVHDVIPLVLPGYHRTRQSSLYSRFMMLTVKRAAAIITVSEHSKRDIVRTLRVPEDHVHVIYEAADNRFSPESDSSALTQVRGKYRLPERFVLYVGGSERRKNLEVLIRAWSRIANEARSREVSLVIVARFPVADALYPDIPRLVSELGLTDSVRFRPTLDEDDKPNMYRAALAVCYPSRYEGFGFPPLEAMASGVPVIASNASSIPEVTGPAAWLIDPDDVQGWADALLRICDSNEERSKLIQRGLERARRFSWRSTAEQTVQVYRDLL